MMMRHNSLSDLAGARELPWLGLATSPRPRAAEAPSGSEQARSAPPTRIDPNAPPALRRGLPHLPACGRCSPLTGEGRGRHLPSYGQAPPEAAIPASRDATCPGEWESYVPPTPHQTARTRNHEASPGAGEVTSKELGAGESSATQAATETE